MVDLSKVDFDHSFDEVSKKILVARGITTNQDLDHRLSSMPEPTKMRGMAEAVGLLVDALKLDQRILILGDYDADGATASALAVRVLYEIGARQIDFLVPNRFEYGYGLSPEIAEVALGFKPDLVITVDNGISSIEGIKYLKDRGVRVIVTDHHLPGAELPVADAIINPNQIDCEFPSKCLAGVGVLFYLMIALRGKLRELGWFTQKNLQEPRLENYLDLVALGTVADLVPLDRTNRLLVINGLKRIHSGEGNPGIKALFEIAGRDLARATSSDLGYAIAPRINAAGRLDDISEGIRCLLEDDSSSARERALNLHHTNMERRQIQTEMTDAAASIVEQMSQSGLDQLPWGLCMYQPDWHQGIVGLVASKMKETLNRPAIAFAKSDSDETKLMELKGSARSVPGLHMRDLLDRIATQNPGLISKFGGHAMAAGLSIKTTDYETFANLFDQQVRQFLNEDDLKAVLWSDGELGHDHLSLDYARKLEQLLPWGQALSEPLFHGEFHIESMRWLKEKHLKMTLMAGPSAQFLDAIWFNAASEKEIEENISISLAYRLNVNEYRGQESLQLIVVDQVDKV